MKHSTVRGGYWGDISRFVKLSRDGKRFRIVFDFLVFSSPESSPVQLHITIDFKDNKITFFD